MFKMFVKNFIEKKELSHKHIIVKKIKVYSITRKKRKKFYNDQNINSESI